MNIHTLTDCHCHITHRLLEQGGEGLLAQLGRRVQTRVEHVCVMTEG